MNTVLFNFTQTFEECTNEEENPRKIQDSTNKKSGQTPKVYTGYSQD